MQAGVIALSHNFQIGNVIVEAVPVFVVDYFFG